ncbi:MAG TPA: GNAT family N-acetyltransferase [Gemmatimonadales bacterium]|nr:GNAT family N-acetyltransferase [Gemmatimonadales bacterium]
MQPTLQTERLVLRPFTMDDADAVTALVGPREIALNTLSIPHPYDRSMAEAWLGTLDDAFERGELLTLAVTLREGGTLVGCVGLTINRAHHRAELGYWTGLDHWGRGYCTEAAAAVVRHAFEAMGLHRVIAHHMSRNPASGRVMQKIGMRHEGTLRGHVLKWGVHEDLELYGLMRDEFERGSPRLAG